MPKPLKSLLIVFSLFVFAGIFAVSWTHWQRLVGDVVADGASSGPGQGVGETSQPGAGAGAGKPSQSADAGPGQATTAESGTAGKARDQSTESEMAAQSEVTGQSAVTGEAPAAPEGGTDTVAKAGGDKVTALTPDAGTGSSGSAVSDGAAPDAPKVPDGPGALGVAVQPSFDIVRVGPTGDMVVAGRAAPGAAVELLSNGSVVATTTGDAAGEFVLVPEKPLAAGGHDLALRTPGGDGVSIYSKNNVAVAVPEEPSGEVLVVMNEPGAASEILAKTDEPPSTDTSTDIGTDTAIAAAPPAETQIAAVPPASAMPDPPPQTVESGPVVPEAKPEPQPQMAETAPVTQPQPQVAQPQIAVTTTAEKPAEGSGGRVADGGQAAPEIARAAPVLLGVEAVEVDGGKLYAAGAARPGAIIRVYIDDELVGAVTASDNGRWLLETEAKVPVGTVTVRADQLAPGGSNVVARIVMPFTRQFDTAILIPRAVGGAPAGATAEGKLSKPNAVIIRRGDNLWTISRRTYGNGMRYTTIFMANKDQIRDPDLIFPGQIFTLPLSDKNWAR